MSAKQRLHARTMRAGDRWVAHCSRCRVTKTVATPAAMKTAVATSERRENPRYTANAMAAGTAAAHPCSDADEQTRDDNHT
jgi:hypothetical protein